MPAVAAHYQLSHLAMERAPEEIQVLIRRHQATFDVAAQGPDLFFYYRPIVKNKVSAMGHRLHGKAGYTLFAPLMEKRAQLSEGTMAYLLGLCCHYALDVHCHPYIFEKTKTSQSHQALESEFERMIVERYALPTKRQVFVPCKGVEADAVQVVYPEITAGMARESSLWLHYVNALFAYPKAIDFFEKLFVPKGVFSTLCMPDRVGEESQAYAIFDGFEKAIDTAVVFMQKVMDKETTKEELAQVMQANFEGVIV